MCILTETQIKQRYFEDMGCSSEEKKATLVSDYDGGDKLCISCTQLDYNGYSKSEQKKILAEWINFLKTNTKVFKSIYFTSHVPQALFDAACCQENLKELRFKWGSYSDLSSLRNLDKLEFLYIGSGSRVKEIEVISSMKNLVVLHIENFKQIYDYSPLSNLDKLEQLVISGPVLGKTPIRDLEFLYDMKNLVSAWFPNISIKRKYTSLELNKLKNDLSNIYFIYNCV